MEEWIHPTDKRSTDVGDYPFLDVFVKTKVAHAHF
jgi:hypothetical protein